MVELAVEELRAVQLRLLTLFNQICAENDFRYSLGGGSLLGAVRHKGYIPWDDDIDIMMPRPDYNQFIQFCLANEVPFGLECFETDPMYVDLSAKVFDLDTWIEDNAAYIQNDKLGVNIDVFPVDGLGDSYKEAQKAFRKTSFKRNLLVAAQWKKFQKSQTHAWYYEPFRFMLYLLGKCVNKQKLFEKILKTYADIDFDRVKYVAAVGGSYREKEIMPREIFDRFIDLPFEGREFKAIADYDTYLSGIYGDYMQLPSEEKRKSHHTFTAYYKEQETK